MTEPVNPPSAAVSTKPSRTRPVDVVLALLVLGFAFLAASFAARNSDVWLHLAAGRLLAHGDYHFGADPFAYTTLGVYWANHAWLFDLGLYLGFQTLGGAGLVLLKAAAVAALAGLMLLLARPARGGPFWVAAGCVMLAVLAMTPRLLLQPQCASLLLLAACLWLLNQGGRALLALPAVIILWVNIDGWFLLGPLVVALFGIGRWLESSLRLPPWLYPACLAACLVSPHHVHVLTLPAELAPAMWASEFRHDPRFAPLFTSPWHWSLLGPRGGYNLAAWAFILVLPLGLASFGFNRSALRSWRLPVWLAFAGLAAWNARLVPFFAAVAGPITALNFREYLANQRAQPGKWPVARALAPTVVVAFGCLALSALTWPGWLQGYGRRDRGLAWEVHADPSLRRAAETLAGWRRTGELPADVRTFNLHPDVANYCAWFAPGEKCFLDARLPLFTPVSAEYESLCRALDPSLAGSSEKSAPPSWPVARSHFDIGCAVLYDADRRNLDPALRQLALPGNRWPLLRVDGQAVIVGWADSPFSRGLHFNAERAVFLPNAADVPPAPGQGPELARSVAPWWESYLERPTGGSWEADAAAIYVRLYEAGAPQQLDRQHARVIARHLAASAALAAQAGGAIPLLAVIGCRFGREGAFLPDVAERPPALPLLGVRAARRAVAERPDDAAAWLTLAQAYALLRETTPEGHSAKLPPLAQVRQIQIVTTLVQAVTLRPELTTAHDMLARLFAQVQYYDFALKHREAQLRLVRRAGGFPGEDPAAFADRLARLEREAEPMRSAVQNSENRYAVRTQGLTADPLKRARVALELGLAGKALDDVLLKSHPDLYGVAGLRLVAELLLLSGRAYEVRDLLDRDELRRRPEGLGFYDMAGGARWGYLFLAYDWCDVCQSAAAGDYDRAAVALKRMRDAMQRDGETNRSRFAFPLAGWLTSEIGVAAAPSALALRVYANAERDQVAGYLLQNQFLGVERADLHALDGLLRLERGEPAEAAAEFRRALELYDQNANSAPALPGRPLTRRCLEWVNPN
ncbi:MAG: hypothetical protein ACJ8F7_21980 [Gemmataceae bacterium]